MVICASVFRNDKSVRHDVLRKTLVIVHHLPHLLGVGLFYCLNSLTKIKLFNKLFNKLVNELVNNSRSY